MSFSTLGLSAGILRAVEGAGYTEPTPIQAAAIPEIIAGHDLIGIAQTGTGKTAAFTLPMLVRLSNALQNPGAPRGIRALVIAPTRELVVQIHENVSAYAAHLPLRVATVFGGVGERPQIEALRSGVDLVIATPGRLLDLMNSRHGDFSRLEFLVMDEADRMLDMGFLPDIRRIVAKLPVKRQTLLFSATLSPEIERLTGEFLRTPKTVQIGRRSNPAETVSQSVYEVPKHLKLGLLSHLLADTAMDTVLVFTRTKHGADRVARRLEQIGIRTAALHANRSQNQRLKALSDFKSGAVRVLVATDIAARGIDVEGISHVVNFDFPPHPEDYVHRIGRTGRAQAVGDAWSFVDLAEERDGLRALERFIGRPLERRTAENFDLKAPAPPRLDPPPARGGRDGGGMRSPRANNNNNNNNGGGGGGNAGGRGGNGNFRSPQRPQQSQPSRRGDSGHSVGGMDLVFRPASPVSASSAPLRTAEDSTGGPERSGRRSRFGGGGRRRF